MNGAPSALPSGGAPATNGLDAINPLCGEGRCSPDNRRECEGRDVSEFLSPMSAVDGGGSIIINNVGPLMEVPDASVVEHSDPDAGVDGGTDAGAPIQDPTPPAPGAGGATGGQEAVPMQMVGDGLGGDQTQLVVACRISVDDGVVSRACGLAGAATEQSPCTSSRDCAPGLACVGQGKAGKCLPFCCYGQEACGDTSFCTELPLVLETPAADPALVPVCAPAEGCSLDQPYPCPDGASCKCGPGTVCTPVHDGLRACLPPGEGTRGGACPCAPGHFCSPVSQRCEKLCDPKLTNSDQCGSDMCQESEQLDWGVCVSR